MQCKLAFFVLLILTVRSAAEAPSGNQLVQTDDLIVKVPGGEHAISFIRLPQSDDIFPLVTKEAQDGRYEAPSLYLGRKEVSLFEVKSLVRQETWEKYQKLVLSRTGSGEHADNDATWGPYRKAVKAGSEDYPAILVDLPTIVEMCETLNKDATLEVNNWTPSLETIVFRIPSRREWQYAARAITTPEDLNAKELFPEWANFDTNMSGDLVEILIALKRPEKKTATPQELIELADAFYKENEGKKSRIQGYKLLGKVLKRALQLEANIAIYGDAEPQLLTDNPKPNAWGFERMIGNAPELVIDKESLIQVDEFWELLAVNSGTLATNQDYFGVLMGGSFFDIVPEFELWKRYSIAHGLRNEGEPWKVNDLVSVNDTGETNELFGDLKSGLRLLIRRQLHPGWFVTFRKEVINDGYNQTLGAKYTGLFGEICTTDKAQSSQLVVDTYERLHSEPEVMADPSWWNVTSSMVREVARAFAATAESAAQPGDESLSDDEIDSLVAGLDLSGMDFGVVGDSETPDSANKDTSATNSGLANEKKSAKIDFFDLLVDLDQP